MCGIGKKEREKGRETDSRSEVINRREKLTWKKPRQALNMLLKMGLPLEGSLRGKKRERPISVYTLIASCRVFQIFKKWREGERRWGENGRWKEERGGDDARCK